MERNDFSVQVPCTILSVSELAEPRPQTRIVNGVEVKTNKLDFTHVMEIRPNLDLIEDITDEQADVIASRTRLYITAYELEHMRSILQARDFGTVCGLVSNSSGNDPCIAMIEYSEYITGTEYVNASGQKFSYQPTDEFGIGSVRYWIELPRQFFTASDFLKGKLLEAHIAAQTKHIAESAAEQKTAMDRIKADMRKRAEAAKARKLAARGVGAAIVPVKDDDAEEVEDADAEEVDDNGMAIAQTPAKTTKSSGRKQR